MKSFHSPVFLLALLAAAAQATDAPKTPVTPQVNALFRVLKADGATVIGQAVIAASGSTAMTTINVRQADALAAANGHCAFNVKYDEVSSVALKGTVNRLYSNDTLVAQNTAIDLAAGVLRSVMTQPYLVPGANNVKVVLNADSKTPSVGWVRINVDGTCKAAASTPPPPPATPPITPASAQWSGLYTAWGYSNYGVTQLKGKGYAHYDDLVRVNKDLTTAVNAKRIEVAAYNDVMARWNAIANDPAFRKLMAAIVPGSGKK
jgi:hypothetical protein